MRTTVKPQKKLGALLLEKKLVNEEQIVEAVKVQNTTGKRMGRVLIENGLISEKDMLLALSEQFSLSCVWLRPGIYDLDAVTLVEKSVLRRLEMLPLIKVRDVLTVATSDPQALPQFDEIEKLTGLQVRPVLALKIEILKTIEEAYSGTGIVSDYIDDLDEDFEVVEGQTPEDFIQIDEMAEGSPVINLVNAMIQRAVRDGVSDIHIEPSPGKCRVRFRIDSMLYEVMSPKIEMHAAIVSRLKVMASLDIAERRLPMDGRMQVRTQGRTVDLRFSSLPGICGEKIVLRVLDKNRSIMDIEKLGMTKKNTEDFTDLLKKSHGLILVTGPTGSGKSTTLYGAIDHLNCLEKNIVTIEDPVEYQLDIINQNQVKEGIGLTYATILKHVLRQDPDIIMIGEIRDRETAEIAIQSALTGHLVLSTLHTNDSVGAIVRLLDMGIEPYLLSSSLVGVIAQRLVRTVCEKCKTSFLPSKELKGCLGISDSENTLLVKGRGCSVCYDSGYKGRIGIHEILRADTDLQELMNSNPTRDQIEAYIKKINLTTILLDGFDRVKRGLTTIAEISRVVRNE